MVCTIDDYALADETLEGGMSLTNLRLRMQRIFDVVIPINEVDPVLFDRNKRRVDITFTVSRVHATIKDAENFCNVHEATIPRTGDIKLISSGTDLSLTPHVTALIINGALVSHELIRQIGKYTEHSYHIIGAPLFAPTPESDVLVTEGGDTITTEGGDAILVE